MHKTRNYNTHRVKPMGQITTSRVSRNGCNKFRVKSQKAKITYKSKTIVVRPWKFIVPVPDKFQKLTKQKSTHTHHPIVKANIAYHSKKAERDLRIANYDQYNQS